MFWLENQRLFLIKDLYGYISKNSLECKSSVLSTEDEVHTLKEALDILSESAGREEDEIVIKLKKRLKDEIDRRAAAKLPQRPKSI